MIKKSIFLSVILSGTGLLAQPVVPIDSVQMVNPTRLAQVQFNVAGKDGTLPDYVHPSFVNPVYEDTVTIEGVVMFDPMSYGLSLNREATFLQMSSGGPWSGIEVMYDSTVSPVQQSVTNFKQNMKKGRTVRVTGIVANFQGETQLTLINVPTQVISLGPVNLAPEVIEVKDLVENIGGVQTPQFVTGEQWEGVYVELKNVTVIQDPANVPNGNRFFWWVQDANGNRLPVRDVSGYYRNDNLDEDPNTPRNPAFNPPPTGSVLPYLRGVIVESGNAGFKSYNIAPLYASDMATAIEPPFINNLRRTPTVPSPSNTVTISADITDNTGTISDARLYYAVGYGNPAFTAVTMTNVSGSRYSANIPAQVEGSVVKYFISAQDQDGNWASYPDSSGQNSAYRVHSIIDQISDIQLTPIPSGQSLFTNDTLNMEIRAVVVSATGDNDLGIITVQDDNFPGSGIFIRWTVGDGLINLKRGDSILIKHAVVTERIPSGSNPFGRTTTSNGVTHLEEIGINGWELLGRCAQIPAPLQIPFDSLMSPGFNKERYESMLLELNNVWIVQKNADSIIGSNFGEFAVNPDVNATGGFRADDYSNDLFINKVSDSLNQNGNIELLASFRGILVNTFGNWKFLPRNRTDMGKAGDLIEPKLSLIGDDTIYVVRTTAINDPGATACDDMDGDITGDVLVDSSAVDVNVNGTYEMYYTVSDAAGNSSGELTRWVIVQPGLSAEKPVDAFIVSLFPVPATENLTLRIESAEAVSAQFTLTDMSGKILLVENLNLSQGLNSRQIGLQMLPSGAYICHISSPDFRVMEKITLIK